MSEQRQHPEKRQPYPSDWAFENHFWNHPAKSNQQVSSDDNVAKQQKEKVMLQQPTLPIPMQAPRRGPIPLKPPPAERERRLPDNPTKH